MPRIRSLEILCFLVPEPRAPQAPKHHVNAHTDIQARRGGMRADGAVATGRRPSVVRTEAHSLLAPLFASLASTPSQPSPPTCHTSKLMPIARPLNR
jgi:hypothetical protein